MSETLVITQEDRKRYNQLSLEDGFVLDSTDTIKCLYYFAELCLEQGLEGVADPDNVSAEIEDLMGYVERVQQESDTRYWKITECAMSASNVHVIPMEEKE